MTLEHEVTKRLDERETYYFGLAGRVAYAATAIVTLMVAGWFLFAEFALHEPYALRNALLATAPAWAGAMTFTALQLRWKVTRQKG